MDLTPLPVRDALAICERAVPRPDLLVHENGAFWLVRRVEAETIDEVWEVCDDDAPEPAPALPPRGCRMM
jgi:hypothetical protein